MITGYIYRKSKDRAEEYQLGPPYPISLQLFLEKYAVEWHIESLERFVFLGSNPLSPDAIFVASWLKRDEAQRILAEEFGIDALLLNKESIE